MNLPRERLADLARTPVLLVACDYDGTIAPIVDDPARAQPNPDTLAAIKSLAALPSTHVAIISGRALHDLASRTDPAGDMHLVGSHGSEFEPGFASTLSDASRGLLRQVARELHHLADATPGLRIEEKPASIALHYRGVDRQTADQIVAAVLAGPASHPGVYVQHGKDVVELSVVQTDKGKALQRVRRRVGASAVIFIGDDATDENAFDDLTADDIGVKVGSGHTHAKFRAADTEEVARLLTDLANLRGASSAAARVVPIERHSLLSDQRSIALVTDAARITWLCAPRIDSAPMFADLIGGPSAGFFEIASADHAAPVSHSYIDDTFILETCWPDFRVIDYLDCSDQRPTQRPGRSDLIRVIEGRGRVKITFAPRLNFNRSPTHLRIHERGLEILESHHPIVLAAPGIDWQLNDDGPNQTASAEVELTDSPLILELRHGHDSFDPAPLSERERRRQTAGFWSDWTASLQIPHVAAPLVRRSALVLRALSHGPTGAIAAAATTSLPEHPGGVRNWDYRYCWLRDGAMSAAALLKLGDTQTATRFLDWMLDLIEHHNTSHHLAPVYTVSGGHLTPEADIAGLSGYLASRPVRIGNMASEQVQLDVFGPIAELVARLAERGAPLSQRHLHLIEMMVAAVQRRWQEPDHGIWELRQPRRHHVHSKVLCWLTVDRGIKVAQYLNRPMDGWPALRNTIAAEVLEKGWDQKLHSFIDSYEDHQPDAAALSVGLSGLLPPDDPRFLGTIDCVERNFLLDSVVYRYKYNDNLPGAEGGFNLCTTWLIQAYALTGRRAQAEALFDKYLALAGPTGLLAEEYDPAERLALGNFPQAYSHLGLINAALRIAAVNQQVSPLSST